jgi:hypothetical protein
MGFALFMSSMWGRGLRSVAGLALIVLGLAGGNAFVGVIGAMPLVAGLLDVCLFAPLFGAPLRGADVRAKATR